MEAKAIEVAGRELVCPICGHKRFWTRKTLMNTRGATFLGLDWANRTADSHICEKCGYVYWFLPDYSG